MSQLERKIGELIQEIAQKGKNDRRRFPCMSGRVVSTDGEARTAKVVLSVDTDETPTEGIKINVTLSNSDGMLMIPADGAFCIVAEVNGEGSWELLRASSYSSVVATVGVSSMKMTDEVVKVQVGDSTSVIVSDGLVRLNGDTLGGLTKTLELQTQINKLNTLVQHLVAIINGPTITEPGSGAASAFQVALMGAIVADEVGDFSNIENENVKHG